MKKLICLLTAILCLIGAAALAEDASSAEAASQDGNTMTVQTGNSGRLNMRQGPNKGAGVVGRYSNGTQVQVLEVTDEWVKVSINGKVGYMMLQYLEESLPEADADADQPALPEEGEQPEKPEDGQEPPVKPENDMRSDMKDGMGRMPGAMDGNGGRNDGDFRKDQPMGGRSNAPMQQKDPSEMTGDFGGGKGFDRMPDNQPDTITQATVESENAR